MRHDNSTTRLAIRRFGQRALFTLACLFSMGSAAYAQPAPAAAQQALESANVVVFNRKIATFRSDFLGVPPRDRAPRTQAIVASVMEEHPGGEVTFKSEPQGNVILIDGVFALILTPDDTDKLKAESLEAATAATVKAIEQLMAATRESRDTRRMLAGFSYSLLGTMVAAVAVWLLTRLRRFGQQQFTRIVDGNLARLQVADSAIISRDRMLSMVHQVGHLIFWALVALIAYEWLSYVLERFPYTRPWGEQLNSFLWGVVTQLGTGLLGAIPNLVTALAIFLLARGVVGMAGSIFDRIERGHAEWGWLDQDLVRPTRRLFSIAIWLFAVAMAYPYLPGAQSDAFKGVSVIAGLMLSLGASSIVGQGASGLILMYSRTIRVGEYVRIADQEGTVVQLGTFATRIRTGLGEELTLPNSLILGTVTKNYSRTVRGPGYILDTTVTIGYDTPWRQVEAMLLEAARRTPNVLADPAPLVFQTALSDFYPEYRLVCQAIPEKPRPRAEVLNVLHANIQDVFNEHGVQIMSPHYVMDPKTGKVVPTENWYLSPAKKPDVL